ncbi:hypothetical protein [Parapedobacter sp. 10938]|uniref:hypothetical protein n=1 Tax=Parapedobacter flavus TaxID=3110225 RepID=UPI002DBE7453|nr:hypothetical protein [Parapedobacter sp. 10938]MEC3880296.1 hypothetical protein [Parapedobacter sp. 10938]
MSGIFHPIDYFAKISFLSTSAAKEKKQKNAAWWELDVSVWIKQEGDWIMVANVTDEPTDIKRTVE